MQLVFMLEELSMKRFLEGFLPQVFPPEVQCVLVPHEGKTDLEKSLPKKLRAWKTPDTYFVVVRDQDAADCTQVKANLQRICDEAGRPDTLIRIACRELEAWFLGDLVAVEHAFGRIGIAKQQQKAKYRRPDELGNPSQEITKLVPEYQKVMGARLLGQHLDPERCCSTSFGFFLSGVRRLVAEKNSAVNTSED